MRIDAGAEIAESKLTDYLLSPRPWDDKSKFLAQAGFTQQNSAALRAAIVELAARVDAVEDGVNAFGKFLRVEGLLRGPNGRELSVVLIWLQRAADGQTHFVTLKPAREKRS